MRRSCSLSLQTHSCFSFSLPTSHQMPPHRKEMWDKLSPPPPPQQPSTDFIPSNLVGRCMVYLFSILIFCTADRVIDWDVCFYEISFSAFNRGIKNGCQQIASGPDPESLLKKMDQIKCCDFLFFFPKWLLKCTAVYRSQIWKKTDENWKKIKCH